MQCELLLVSNLITLTIQFNNTITTIFDSNSAACALASCIAVRVRTIVVGIPSKIRVKLDSATSPTNSIGHHNGVGFHAFEGLAGNLLESLLYADAFFGRSFIERYSVVGITPFFALFTVHFTLAFTIYLIAQNNEWE